MRSGSGSGEKVSGDTETCTTRETVERPRKFQGRGPVPLGRRVVLGLQSKQGNKTVVEEGDDLEVPSGCLGTESDRNITFGPVHPSLSNPRGREAGEERSGVRRRWSDERDEWGKGDHMPLFRL